MVITIKNSLISSSPGLVLPFGPMEEDVCAVMVQDLHLWGILLREKQEV